MPNTVSNQPTATEGYARPPKPLEISGNMALAWNSWIQQYDWFAAARELDTKSEIVQVGTFMSCIGPDAIDIFNSLSLTPAETKSITSIRGKFEAHFTPKTNITFERYVFNKIMQSEGEPFDDFITKATLQIKKCSYGSLQDSILRDKIITGINNDSLREKLLATDDIKLDDALKKCRANELAQTQLQTIHKDDSHAIHAVSKPNTPKAKKYHNNNRSPFTKAAKDTSQQMYTSSPSTESKSTCKRCGYIHQYNQCPAFDKKCTICRRRGHFAKLCKKAKNSKTVNTMEQNYSDSDTDESLLVLSLSKGNQYDDDDWYEDVKLNNINFKVKLDTGAQCNVISKDLALKLSAKITPSSTKKLVAFNGSNENVSGETVIKCIVRGKMRDVLFKVVDHPVNPMFGKKACEMLNLVMRVQQIQADESVYKGLGCAKSFIYDIDLVHNPSLNIYPARKIPHSIRDEVKREIDTMVKMGVMVKTSKVTPAVSPMVVVKQKNKIRVCMDPSDINKNIFRRQHPLRTIEEITARIRNSKYFTLLDMKKGFWQIPLTERSSDFLTMATPWGRYSYKRLPFGLASAPEVFQNMMCQILEGCKNTECAIDDILVHAETKEELILLTNDVIKKVSGAGLKMNKDKCVFNANQIKFLGHVLSSNGIKPDEEKVSAINRLKIPQNKTELMRLLGMATYLTKFTNHFSHITHPLRKLLKSDVEWQWTQEQTDAFESLKHALSNTPVLKFYDPNKDVTLQVDASSHSLGAALLQDDCPVAYASRAMTETQQKYPQIEKEALAMQFACSKFREYIYGKPLVIETDHKPLEAIAKKPLHSSPHRLQRILFEVMQYSPHIKYRRGKEIGIADALSRDCKNNPEPEKRDELEVCSLLQITAESKEDFIKETNKDTELQQLKQCVLNGWPKTIQEVNETLRGYWTFRDEIGTDEDLLFKGNKLIVPTSLRSSMLKKLHYGHFGIQRTLSRAREQLFWLNITNDITQTIEHCPICQKVQPSKVKEPLILKQVPSLPFEIVACDIFHMLNNDYLLIVDSYSGFFEFAELKRSSSAEVIQKLKVWFSTHGIPLIFESDNGPQFSAKEFKLFASTWGFKHQTSSPYYPRSNGLAERYVQTAKQLLRKCQLDGSDIYLALLNFRNTSRSPELKSPSQRLFSRQTRCHLPVPKCELAPRVIKNVQEEMTHLRNEQKLYADKSIKPSSQFQPDEKVRIQEGHRRWSSGTIQEKTSQPRSYLVKTADGKIKRRNTIHLQRTKADIIPERAIVPQENNNNFSTSDKKLPTTSNPNPQPEITPTTNIPRITRSKTKAQQNLSEKPSPQQPTPTIVLRSGKTLRTQ